MKSKACWLLPNYRWEVVKGCLGLLCLHAWRQLSPVTVLIPAHGFWHLDLVILRRASEQLGGAALPAGVKPQCSGTGAKDSQELRCHLLHEHFCVCAARQAGCKSDRLRYLLQVRLGGSDSGQQVDYDCSHAKVNGNKGLPCPSQEALYVDS